MVHKQAVATLAQRDSLTLTAFNPLHSDNAIDSICFHRNNITINITGDGQGKLFACPVGIVFDKFTNFVGTFFQLVNININV